MIRRLWPLWPALLLCLSCAAPPKPIFGDGPRRIIVISLDTLRADHLGCYGYEKPTSPVIDNLAAGGVRFSRATAPSNWTLPSHASLFTGLYASRHGILNENQRLGDEPTHLVEELRNSGFATAAFTGGGFLDASYGLDRGFDHYESQEDFEHTWSKTLQRARGWLTDHATEDVFLFLHTYEIHAPYTAPHEYVSRMTTRRRMKFGGHITQLQEMMKKGDEVREQDIRNVVIRYDAGIAYTDELLGGFLERLAEQGLDQNLLLIITSDHGEELWDHGDHGHNENRLGSEVTDVPLIVRMPDGSGAGLVVEDEVSFLDVMPTVLAAAMVSRPPGLDGYSLLHELAGRPISDRDIMPRERRRIRINKNETGVGLCEGRQFVVAGNGQWRLLSRLPSEQSASHDIWPALYDLSNDPTADIPLPASGAAARELDSTIERLLGSGAKLNHTPPAVLELDDAARRQLEALGYL